MEPKETPEWPFIKNNKQQTKEMNFQKQWATNPLKILLLSWNTKNAILSTFSEERGRFCLSAVHNRECIDKDLVRLTSLNIHSRKVLMIYINMSFHSRSLPCLATLEPNTLAPTTEVWHLWSWEKKKQQHFLSTFPFFLPLLQNKV